MKGKRVKNWGSVFLNRFRDAFKVTCYILHPKSQYLMVLGRPRKYKGIQEGKPVTGVEEGAMCMAIVDGGTKRGHWFLGIADDLIETAIAQHMDVLKASGRLGELAKAAGVQCDDPACDCHNDNPMSLEQEADLESHRAGAAPTTQPKKETIH